MFVSSLRRQASRAVLVSRPAFSRSLAATANSIESIVESVKSGAKKPADFPQIAHLLALPSAQGSSFSWADVTDLARSYEKYTAEVKASEDVSTVERENFSVLDKDAKGSPKPFPLPFQNTSTAGRYASALWLSASRRGDDVINQVCADMTRIAEQISKPATGEPRLPTVQEIDAEIAAVKAIKSDLFEDVVKELEDRKKALKDAKNFPKEKLIAPSNPTEQFLLSVTPKMLKGAETWPKEFGKLHPLSLTFLELIVRDGAMSPARMKKIAQELDAIQFEYKKVLDFEVVTVDKLDAKTTQQFQEFVNQAVKADYGQGWKATLTNRTDPSILGGFYLKSAKSGLDQTAATYLQERENEVRFGKI
jgi:F0F1-type ATP synthase delta subunit